MTDARLRIQPSLHRLLLSGVTFAAAAGLFVIGAYELASEARGSGPMKAAIVVLCASAALAFTATAHLRALRLFVPLGFVVGAAFILYGLAVISMGYEDVGGAPTAIPLSLATAGLGLWLVVAAVIETSRWHDAA
jgi:hypothetical protein